MVSYPIPLRALVSVVLYIYGTVSSLVFRTQLQCCRLCGVIFNGPDTLRRCIGGVGMCLCIVANGRGATRAWSHPAGRDGVLALVCKNGRASES